MKNSLLIIASLIILIWSLIYFGFHSGAGIHILLVAAGFILLVRIIFNKQLSQGKLIH